MLGKLKIELDQRDLSDLPTDKLLDLFLKEGVVKDSLIEPVFKTSTEIEEEKEVGRPSRKTKLLKRGGIYPKSRLKDYRVNKIIKVI